MVSCKRLSKCPVVKNSDEEPESISGRIKKKYCYNNFSECARYMVLEAVGGEFVPADLMPDQPGRAKEIIEEAMELL
jgi:hypothetical protein